MLEDEYRARLYYEDIDDETGCEQFRFIHSGE